MKATLLMKLRYLIPLFFCGSLAFAEGPVFRHKEPTLQLEFDNAYQDIRTVLTLRAGKRCIDDPTLCVDVVTNTVEIKGASGSPGVLALFDDAGSDYFIWVDSDGELRGHTSYPADDDADGVVIKDLSP